MNFILIHISLMTYFMEICKQYTVKFLNFGTLENFAVIILKLDKRGFTIK